jgi:UDP-glucose 4-epimerase
VTVLVTGASGLVGRQLLGQIASRHEVVALTRRTDPPDEAGEGVDWVRQDLTEPLDERALPSRLDAIVHLAQSQRYRDFPDGAEDLFEVNVHSTARLLRLARRSGAERFVLASTGGVYGFGAQPITEEAPLALSGPYFRSKRMSELLLEDYADLLVPVALRFFFVYGPGKGQTLIPRLADRIVQGEQLTVEGDPGMRMNPIYAGDAAAAIAAALDVDDPAVINVAGQEVVTVTGLIERLARALGRDVRVTHTGECEGDLIADTSRMAAVLGVTASTGLDEGLAAVAHARLADSAAATRSPTSAPG